MHAGDDDAVDRSLDDRLLDDRFEAQRFGECGRATGTRGVQIALAPLPRLLRADVLAIEPLGALGLQRAARSARGSGRVKGMRGKDARVEAQRVRA
jgi:hypothetical protein